MKKRTIKTILVTMAALMLVTSAACGTSAPAATSASTTTTSAPAATSAPTTTTSESATAQATETAPASAVDNLSGITLKFWKPLYWTGKVASDKDNIAWQTVQQRLGVKLDFIQPASGQEQDMFNLMVGSNDLPDIISTDWSCDALYVGGLDKYVKDGVLIKLNDLVPVYAPDYLKAIKTVVKPEEQKEFYTDSGSMVEFYGISPYEAYAYQGLLFRKEWMDQLGLQNPKTLADVEATLTAFKNTIGAKSPLIFPASGIDTGSGVFISAFGIGPAFYQKDSTVLYGPMQPEFKDYLALMNDWYKKGLIDQDFASRDGDAIQRLYTSGESGALINSADATITNMKGIGTMMAGNYPVQKDGDTIKWRLKNYQNVPFYAVAVTTACKTPEAAVKFLNYGYTEPGYMLYNYGEEGQTYNLVDGKPKYTDLMLNNPDFPVNDAILKFKLHVGPFIRYENEGNPAITTESLACNKFWTEGAGTDMVMPMVTLTAEEGSEYARIMGQVNTYVTTATLKFIMGTDSLDNFEKYDEGLKKLEIDKVVSMEQAAMDRYSKRQVPQ